MNVIFALLALSTLLGLGLGLYFSWISILMSGPATAIVSATVLQVQGWGPLAGIAISAVCLAVNQIAFFIGAALATHGRDR
jgi:hypothetical protein